MDIGKGESRELSKFLELTVGEWPWLAGTVRSLADIEPDIPGHVVGHSAGKD